jgi:hypothetical protein
LPTWIGPLPPSVVSTKGHRPPAAASHQPDQPGQILAEVGPILDRGQRPPHAAAEVGASRSPSSPATAPWSSSAGQPTPVPATPWAPSPTTAATPLPGQPACTGKPAGVASATPGYPHPDACLAAGHLGQLAYRPALRHQPPPRRTTADTRTRGLGLTQGTRARCLWHAGGTAGGKDDARTWRRRLPARLEGETGPW